MTSGADATAIIPPDGRAHPTQRSPGTSMSTSGRRVRRR